MIKFFRQIRHRLLTDNKFSKYLLYAIGEIALVMIGILLALQVNNWNDERKLKVDEINTLYNFRENLSNDLLSFDSSLQYIQRASNSMELVLSLMKQDKPYQDSLKYHFGMINSLITPSINTSTFESLKSKNLNLISNKNLRQHIILLYDSENNHMVNLIEEYRAIVFDASANLYDSRFDEFWKAKDTVQIRNNRSETILIPEMNPIDFEKLKKDKEYLYFLKSLKNQHRYLIEDNIEERFASLKQLLAKIDEELSILENK